MRPSSFVLALIAAASLAVPAFADLPDVARAASASLAWLAILLAVYRS